MAHLCPTALKQAQISRCAPGRGLAQSLVDIMKQFVCLLTIVFLLAGSTPVVLAQVKPSDLAQATLEDLLNIHITSAERKEQKAEEVPAAVYVLTRDEIRRSGLTTVPE